MKGASFDIPIVFDESAARMKIGLTETLDDFAYRQYL
jgi:hypothetical protein